MEVENLRPAPPQHRFSEARNSIRLAPHLSSLLRALLLLHVGLTTEVLRQKLIADREAMGEAEAGAERAFHVAHESVGGMLPGEMEPV